MRTISGATGYSMYATFEDCASCAVVSPFPGIKVGYKVCYPLGLLETKKQK